MGLSEPAVLNDVVGFRRRGATPPAVARAADLSLRLLGRPFGPGEAVIVKPSNILNPLAELLLTIEREGRALFLYAPLETFLISVTRKGLHCRAWVRELLEGYVQEGFVDRGRAALAVHEPRFHLESGHESGLGEGTGLLQFAQPLRLLGQAGPEAMEIPGAETQPADFITQVRISSCGISGAERSPTSKL